MKPAFLSGVALACGAALALSSGFAAQAQTTPPAPADQTPPPSGAAATPSQPGAPATAASLKVGLPVVDNTGAPLGAITQLTTLQGTQVAVFPVDGKPAAVPFENLTMSPSGDHVVLSANKAQLLATLPH